MTFVPVVQCTGGRTGGLPPRPDDGLRFVPARLCAEGWRGPDRRRRPGIRVPDRDATARGRDEPIVQTLRPTRDDADARCPGSCAATANVRVLCARTSPIPGLSCALRWIWGAPPPRRRPDRRLEAVPVRRRSGLSRRASPSDGIPVCVVPSGDLRRTAGIWSDGLQLPERAYHHNTPPMNYGLPGLQPAESRSRCSTHRGLPLPPAHRARAVAPAVVVHTS